MRPDDTMQIEYQMNKRELAEMCVRALAEVFVKQKILLTIVLIMTVYGILDIIMNLTSSGKGNVLGIGLIMIVFLGSYFVVAFVEYYRYYIKAGLLQPQRLRLEQGYLLTGLDGGGRFPCRSYNVIKRGRRILMLGTRNSSRVTSYIGIPKRAFSSPEEQEAFLWLMANSCPSEENQEGQPILDRGGDIVLTFDITPERWAHIYGEVIQIHSDKSLLGRKKSWARYFFIVVLGMIMLQNALTGSYSATGYLIYVIAFLAGAGILLMMDGFHLKSSDNRYRNMAAQGKIQNDTLGWWEAGIRRTEGYVYHNGKYIRFPWTEYCHRFDMGDTLFFFDRSGKRYTFIPKEALGSQEDAARFYDYFYQQGLTFTAPSLMSSWNPKKIAGIVLLSLSLGLTAMINLYTFTARMFQNPNAGFDFPASTEETTAFVFRPEDYPDYMPLAVQIEVLKSLGIQVPGEESLKQYQKWMEENDYYRAYLEGSPYVGILGELGAGEFDENTEEYLYHPSVYWFDFEGWDIREDYIDILKAFHVMGSGEFELTELKEDLQNADWEQGTGAILVMFRYNGHAYAFEARMMYDWIDPDIIGFFNEVLEREKNPKRIYYMDDGGQGAILFYNTKAWADEFFSKTGIMLEAPTRSAVESWIDTKQLFLFPKIY